MSDTASDETLIAALYPSASAAQKQGDPGGEHYPSMEEKPKPDLVKGIYPSMVKATPEPVANEKAASPEKPLPFVEALSKHLGEEKGTVLAKQLAEEDLAAAEHREGVWRADVHRDSEIGGVNHEVATKHARLVVQEFGTPELSQLLAGGLGNHPELLRVFARIGKALARSGHLSE